MSAHHWHRQVLLDMLLMATHVHDRTAWHDWPQVCTGLRRPEPAVGFIITGLCCYVTHHLSQAERLIQEAWGHN